MHHTPGKYGRSNPTEADCSDAFGKVQDVLAKLSIRSAVLDSRRKADPKAAYSDLATLLLNLEETLKTACIED